MFHTNLQRLQKKKVRGCVILMPFVAILIRPVLLRNMAVGEAETFVPTGRDFQLKSANRWLKFKRKDDCIGQGLWRIHDGLYDFRAFMHKHPGGLEWLEMTEGQDVTEAFEAAHIRSDRVEKIAEKYFVGKIHTPRTSVFTFEAEGSCQ